MSRKKAMNEGEYDLEKTLAVLQHVAEGFGEKSAEYRAVKIAAQGLMFLQQREIHQQFDAYVKNVGKELPSRQLKHLKNMGLI